jgi:sugar phosphate permease
LGVVAATLPIVEPRDSLVQGGPPPALNLGQLLGRLGVTNALIGLGVGLLGPLLTYWFYRRYGVGAAEVGVLYTVVNLAAAVPYLGSSALTRRLGTIRTVAITRFGSAVTLFVMAAMPSFALAGLLYTLRMMLNSLGMPARQSYVMGVSEHRYRSRVSAFGNLPSQVTATIVPALAGSVMGSFIDAPILGSAFFIGMNALAYYVFFRKAPPPEEQTEAAAGAASHRST